jgi:hypothetical protein
MKCNSYNGGKSCNNEAVVFYFYGEPMIPMARCDDHGPLMIDVYPELYVETTEDDIRIARIMYD